jgi:hypothetical protein
MRTYECTICGAVNHVSRFHCHACGTIPAGYSWLRKPIIERLEPAVSTSPESPTTSTIEVYVAYGVERQMTRRTIKRTGRTVPLDYYAEV